MHTADGMIQSVHVVFISEPSMGSIAIDHVSTVNCQNTVCQLSVYTLSCGSFAAVTETHFETDKIKGRRNTIEITLSHQRVRGEPMSRAEMFLAWCSDFFSEVADFLSHYFRGGYDLWGHAGIGFLFVVVGMGFGHLWSLWARYEWRVAIHQNPWRRRRGANSRPHLRGLTVVSIKCVARLLIRASSAIGE